MSGVVKSGAALGAAILFAAFVFTLPALSQRDPAEVKKGQSLYSQYCRSCHGDGARGDGPAASALKVQPSDLTQIARKNNGFPTDKVMDWIDGEKYAVGHGSREMPVWGKRFRRSPGGEKGTQSEIVLLTNYLESIQQH